MSRDLTVVRGCLCALRVLCAKSSSLIVGGTSGERPCVTLHKLSKLLRNQHDRRSSTTAALSAHQATAAGIRLECAGNPAFYPDFAEKFRGIPATMCGSRSAFTKCCCSRRNPREIGARPPGYSRRWGPSAAVVLERRSTSSVTARRIVLLKEAREGRARRITERPHERVHLLELAPEQLVVVAALHLRRPAKELECGLFAA